MVSFNNLIEQVNEKLLHVGRVLVHLFLEDVLVIVEDYGKQQVGQKHHCNTEEHPEVDCRQSVHSEVRYHHIGVIANSKRYEYGIQG